MTATPGKGPKGTNPLTGSSRFRLAAPSRLTALRVCGSGRAIALPAVVSFSLGREPAKDDPPSPRADVLVPSPRKGVSLIHATFEWRHDRLWCRDARSTNGTLSDAQPQHDWFLVTSGTTLDLGDTRVIAMDWRLAAICEPLAWCVGLDAVDAVDRALVLAQKDGPLLLTGPKGCDQAWLAQQIHEASGRRTQPFTAFTELLTRGAAEQITQARWGTVFVDLASVGKVSQAFATALFAGEGTHLRVRPIIAAPSHLECQRAFQHLAHTPTIALPPLAARRDEIPRLIDWLMIRHKASCRLRDVTPDRLERLVEHGWRNNLTELRETERRLRAVLETGSMAQAAQRVGSSRQALGKYLRRIFGD